MENHDDDGNLQNLPIPSKEVSTQRETRHLPNGWTAEEGLLFQLSGAKDGEASTSGGAGNNGTASETTDEDKTEESSAEEKKAASDRERTNKAVNEVPLIPLILRKDDGELIHWGGLSRASFKGYASLARLVRSFCTYYSPECRETNIVHIISPWLRHTAVYLDEDGGVLNPMARWEDFAQKLNEIYMIPLTSGSLVVVCLPGMPNNNLPDVFGLPRVNLGAYYWFRFQRTSGTREKVFTVNRRSIRSYRRFFWIINGLWTSWHGKEPLNAADLTEYSVVRMGKNLIKHPPDEIKFIDYDGETMKAPIILNLYAKRMELQPLIGTEADEDDERDEEAEYPHDPNYASTWDFLSQVVQVIVING